MKSKTAKCYTLSLNAVLIPNLQYAGAAIATVASSGISVLVQYSILHQQINIKPIVLYLIKYLLLSIPMFIIVAILGENMVVSPVTTLIQILVGCIIYVVSCAIVKDNILLSIVRIALSVIRREK